MQFAPVREIHESSISDLISFAKRNNCESLYSMLKLADNEKIFCEEYYNKFDEACENLRYLNMNGNNL